MEEVSESSKQAARTAIQKIAKTFGIDVVEIINATVKSVDKAKRTCVVTPISGRSTTDIEDVGLMPERNDGVFKIPAIDSTVGVVMSTQVPPYIVSWSDLDEWYLVIGKTTIDVLDGSIEFGDGSYNGLVIVGDLVDKLNNLENKVNDIITSYTAHTHPYVNVSAPATTSPTVVAPPISPLTPTTQSDIENDEIIHGKATP